MRIITKAVLAVSMAVMCAGTAHAQEKGTDQKPYRYEGSVNISFSHMIRPGIFTLHGVRMDEGRWFLGGVLAADIFYILPTCVWDWTAEDGQSCRYSDYTRTDHIEAFLPSVELAEDIFAQGQYGFYCPYYRQISLNVWMDGEAAVEELFPLSMEDISAAFDYYLDNYNEGRPFVLAGFSQGGKAVVELVKHLPAEAYERMVAAYAIGYRISDEEVEQYPQLHPATDSTGTGTIISYNSAASPEAACAVLSPSDVCINPVNWTTEAVPAALNDSVTVTVDTLSHLLIVDGLDPEAYFLSSLAPMFPLGNYHLQELTLYQEHLRRNTALRVRNFTL